MLYKWSLDPPLTGLDPSAELYARGAELEKELQQISLQDVPLSAIMLWATSDRLTSAPLNVTTTMLREAWATSEIFRNCALIYLFRVVNGDNVPLDSRTQGSLDEVLPRISFN